MNRARDRLRAPLFAAVLLSAVAHAAAVWVADARAPVGATTDPVTEPTRASAAPMHARVAAALPPTAAPPTAPLDLPSPVLDARSGSATPKPTLASRAPATNEPAALVVAEAQDDSSVDRRPKPLTYPVLSLPTDDDPHRVGLVRLMLVVSSEGRVVRTVVTAATLPQDYVDRIASSFDSVRFAPAIVHGFPRAGWYEVVVDLAFDPEARSSL